MVLCPLSPVPAFGVDAVCALSCNHVMKFFVPQKQDVVESDLFQSLDDNKDGSITLDEAMDVRVVMLCLCSVRRLPISQTAV
jgi:hypothetical protein